MRFEARPVTIKDINRSGWGIFRVKDGGHMSDQWGYPSCYGSREVADAEAARLDAQYRAFEEQNPEMKAITDKIDAQNAMWAKAKAFIKAHRGTDDLSRFHEGETVAAEACDLIEFFLSYREWDTSEDLYWALNRIVKKHSPKSIALAKAALIKAKPGREPGT